MFAPVFLGGCFLLEPTATSRFSTHPGTPTERLFDCIEGTLRSPTFSAGPWHRDVTKRDLAAGILETGRFEEANVSGIRTRVTYDPATGNGHLKIKASGAYFHDLGADAAAARLTNGISRCLQPAR